MSPSISLFSISEHAHIDRQPALEDSLSTDPRLPQNIPRQLNCTGSTESAPTKPDFLS